MALEMASGETTPPRRRLAVVTTVWNYRSHAWHMAERFLHGYPKDGHWHRPPFQVVAAYVDQQPKADLSQSRAKEFGFTIYPTIAEALRCGGDKLAVDAVLIIGEHGNYPKTKYEQTQYPRYEFFKQVAAVFEKDQRVTPVFNDKHLSWNWDYAKEMVELAGRLKIPFLAGSSLPVTWRMPAVDLPRNAEVEEIMCVAMGSIDSYDFHALETIQCVAEWQALAHNSWATGGWDATLFDACLCRSQTLAQPETFSHRYPTVAQMKTWVKNPVLYRFEYIDGVKASMFLLNGLVGDFTLAAKIKGQAEPFSTLFYLPPNPNVTYSAALMSMAEELFTTGKPPYPIERTLLTTGLVEAGVRSLGEGSKRLETPHLAIKYLPPNDSLFARS
jgi:hypothetical protein